MGEVMSLVITWKDVIVEVISNCPTTKGWPEILEKWLTKERITQDGYYSAKWVKTVDHKDL